MARFLPLAGLRMCRGGGFSPSCRCASWPVLPVWRVRGYAAVAGSAPVVGAHRGGSFLCAGSGVCGGGGFSPSCRCASWRVLPVRGVGGMRRWRVQPQLSVRMARFLPLAGLRMCRGDGFSPSCRCAWRGSFRWPGYGCVAVAGSAPVVGAHRGRSFLCGGFGGMRRWRVQPQLSVRIVAGPSCARGRGSVRWAEVQPQLSVRMARFLPLAGLRMCRGDGFSPSCRCAWRGSFRWPGYGCVAVAGSAPVVGAHRGGSFLWAGSGVCGGGGFSPSCRCAWRGSFRWPGYGCVAVAGSAPVVGAHRGRSFLCAGSGEGAVGGGSAPVVSAHRGGPFCVWGRGERCVAGSFSPSCRYARRRSFLLLELPK